MDFYEVKVKPFQGRAYPNLGSTDLVGYDGISPGPTFKIVKGRESVVRFVNEYDRPSAVHLHGSPSRAPFDGWAEDTFSPGEYKVMKSLSLKAKNCLNLTLGLLLPELSNGKNALVS